MPRVPFRPPMFHQPEEQFSLRDAKAATGRASARRTALSGSRCFGREGSEVERSGAEGQGWHRSIWIESDFAQVVATYRGNLRVRARFLWERHREVDFAPCFLHTAADGRDGKLTSTFGKAPKPGRKKPDRMDILHSPCIWRSIAPDGLSSATLGWDPPLAAGMIQLSIEWQHLPGRCSGGMMMMADMSPQDFVWQLNAVVVEESTATYRDLLFNTDADKASDPYWKRVLTLFSELPPEQREVLLELTRQVAIDATANVLGVIDGACALKAAHSRFHLTCGGQDLAGDLQSLFLEQAEQSSP